MGDRNNDVPGRILMQRESSLKVWDQQSLYVAKKGYVKVCMFIREPQFSAERTRRCLMTLQDEKGGVFFSL